MSAQEDITPSRGRSHISTDLTCRSKDTGRMTGPSVQHASEHGRSAARATHGTPQTKSTSLSQGFILHEDISKAPQADITVSGVSSAKTGSSGFSSSEAIRAARLRHFQVAPNVQTFTVGTPRATPQSHGTPTRRSGSKFRVPSGASCIDLTDE